MKHLSFMFHEAFGGALILSLALYAVFIAFEPYVSDAAAVGRQLIVSQQITTEISFLTNPTDVTLSPSIGGVTGGQGDGMTYFRVLTNNTTGYSATITSSSTGMVGNPSGTIPALVVDWVVPQRTFTTAPANSAAFAYSVHASTSADLSQKFKQSAGNCNAGSSDVLGECWLAATTSAAGDTIINRTTATPSSGATTTIQFRTVVSANAVLPSGTYYSTSTITATTN